MNTRSKVARALAVGSVLMGALVVLPQVAQAQYGQGRYGYGQDGARRNRDRNDRYTYGRIDFDWDLNGFNVRDRERIEREIRRELNTNPGSRSIGRRSGSDGRLDVNVALHRENSNRVRADVRIGLNQDGRGAAAVTATESATTQSRDRSFDGQFILDAFQKARREFGGKVNQYTRDNR